MKKGLVLEGGALRGLFTVGILDVMMEHNITPDGFIGVSAGAAFGCNMKSRQPGRAIRYNTNYAKDWRYCSIRSYLKTGDLFGGEFDYHYLPAHLDIFDEEAFDNNHMEMYVVCTDVTTGKAVYKKLDKSGYNCYEWIRASASMPLASRIVKIDGYQLLDGGIADSIPLRYFQEIGYEKNIVILTQPDGYVKEKNKFLPLMKLQLRKYPRFIEAAANRHLMYNEETAYVKAQEALGNTLVIRPKEALPIGHISHDPEEMWRVYHIGRAAGEERLQDILRFMQE